MRILFIVTESESANGICTRAVMNEFIKRGHNVLCITNQETGKENKYTQNGIVYYTVKPRLVYRLNNAYGEKTAGKTIKRNRSIAYLLNKLKLVLSLPAWPLISPAYANRITELSRSVHKQYQIDCVIPIYTQIDTLIAANKLKEENPDMKYVPYFLDSLSGGYGPRIFSSKWVYVRGVKWERRLLSHADLIIMMESAKKHYETCCSKERYYKKIKFLDLPLLICDHEPKDYVESFLNKNKFNLLYVGSFPPGIRSPQYILDVFANIKDENWRFYFIGDNTCSILNEAAQKDRRIVVVGRCDHEQAMKYESQADMLINIGNSNPNMTPSKIFEYMSWGKKIVSTAPIDDEPSLKYLKKYPLSIVLSEQELDIDKSAQKLLDFAKAENSICINEDDMNQIYYNNTPGAFVEMLNQILI